ncbi:MAG: hypothetical protein EA407_05715 [Rhodobacteraceae bacterium]|nr:MAG: hypothetical protein EA407_05715 [Paracoccaceae bacterium]
MNTGQRVSGVAHIGLIVWVMVFDLFQVPDSAPRVPVTDVSLISAEEFAALTSPGSAPPPPPDPPPEPEPQPDLAPATEPEPEPEIRAPEPVQPEPQAAPQPEPEPEPAPAAPSTGVVFSPLPAPGASVRPRPRPVDRVAPTPTEAPPDTAEVDIAAAPPAEPEPEVEAEPEIDLPEQVETAPPEATTEIVTEATETDDSATERAAMAPEISQRPRTRPERPSPPAETELAAAPAPEPAPAPTPEPATAPESPPAPGAAEDAIAQALAEALADSPATSPQPGTSSTLSASEADSLRLAIQQCWNVGVLSSDAQQVTVTVGFSMTPSARHEQGSIRIVSASGGSEPAVQQAFDAARRAIIRCEGDGYGLPPEKYEAWRDIEITFNPEGMRLR